MSRAIIDPDFTSPSFQLVNLYDLIALPKEAEEHIKQGHTISGQKGVSPFYVCSCQGFRAGIIVDKRTLSGSVA